MQPDAPNDAEPAFRRYLERPRRRRLARLVDAYYRFVWDTALRVTGNAADAADITQDVFLKLLLHPPRPEQVRSPRGYLAWEVVGRASSLARAAERRRAREQVAASRVREDGLSAADLDELRARVRELPGDLRSAVELRYFAGLRNGDIAAVTGVGERHVEKRLERAREMLRSRIGPAAPLIVLLDRAAADGSPLGSSSEPPGGLRAELLMIAAHGAVLAPPLVKAAAAAGGMTLAQKGATAIAAAAVLLLGGVSTSVFFSTRRDPGGESRPEVVRLEPTPEPAAGGATPIAASAGSVPRDPESGAPFGSLRGAVSDEDGKRVAGARVTLRGLITEEQAEDLRKQGFLEAEAGPVDRETLTSETGEYSFARLFPASVTVNVEKSPYLVKYLARVKPKAAEETECDLILCVPVRLFGIVRTPEGDAVKGAEVFISFDHAKHYYEDPARPEPAIDHAFPVDDDGNFDTGFGIVNIRHLCVLPGYVLAPGREMKEFRVDCHDFKGREVRIKLLLAPERRLTFLVEDPLGAPVAGALLTASDLAIHRVVTDAGGRAALDRLPAERFSVGVSRDGYFGESIHTAAIDSTEVRIVLQPLGTGIEGQVTFDDALPESNREVDEIYFHELGPDDKILRLFRDIRFDDRKNTFCFNPKGPLRFEAICEMGWRTLARKPLVYDGRNKLRVDFHVRLEPPYISGRVVRAATRELLPAFPVTLHLPWRDREIAASWENYTFLNDVPFPRLPGNKSTVSTGADGSFLFLLSATDRHRAGIPLAVRAILTAGSDEVGYSADLALDLDIHSDTVVKDIELEVQGFGAIEGQVIDEAGEPLAGAHIAAYDGYQLVKHVKASGAGGYRIEGLRPGRYLLEFLGHAPAVKMGAGGGEADAEGLPRPSELFDRPVSVEAGETSRWDIDLRTDALGAIDGVVPPELGAYSRAECGLLIGDRPRGGSAFGRDVKVRHRRFQLENLLPGTYRVWLCGRGEARISEADVAVKRGPRTSLVMPVSSGSLVIPLERPSGLPAAGANVVKLVRREAYRREGWPVSTEVAASRVTVEDGRVRLEGLVSGSLQAMMTSPGFQAIQSEPVWVAQGQESVAPALMLVPGRSVRVRLELPDGLKLPGKPSFTVIDPRTGDEVLVTAARQGEGLTWEISGLPDGAFTIRVYPGSGFLEAEADAIAGQEDSVEVLIRLERDRS